MHRDAEVEVRMPKSSKTFTLLGSDGKPHSSLSRGTLGGHRGRKLYGRLDCRAALQAIARGGYVKHRVFFADEAAAIAAGYRPCAVCMPREYAAWKKAQPAKTTNGALTQARSMSALLSKSTSADGLIPPDTPETRVAVADWSAVEDDLGRDGFAVMPSLLTAAQCEELIGHFFQEARFRSRIVMERYGFGRGEYKYFSYPLPDVVGRLRKLLYSRLAPIANRWHAAMRIEGRFPATHEEFLAVCHAAGQQRPTPLLLRYRANDYCCLHQDLYGEHVFPFQAIFLLNAPGSNFEGGELLLAESNPKKPGRADVVPLRQGDAVILAVNYRPVRSARGFYRATLRHGVSRLLWGQRHTLGIIFHDAQ